MNLKIKMKKLINKPYLLYLINVSILLLILKQQGDEALDINIHDTYFPFYDTYFIYILLLVYGLISLGYWLILKNKKKLNQWLIHLHILLSITGGVLTYKGVISIYNSIASYSIDNELLQTGNTFLIFGVFVFLTGQLFYLVNILKVLISRK